MKWKKEVILNIGNVYTANAFRSGDRWQIGAGSETGSEVYLYDLAGKTKHLVDGCPGGMMSFVPVPGTTREYISVMGLFPPFKGLDAGIYHHRESAEGWDTQKVMHLPFAHRCDFLRRGGRHFLFAVSVSRHKDEPADWSRPGEIYVEEWGPGKTGSFEGVLVDAGITRNHGLLRHKVDGKETLLFSGKEGVFYLDFDGSRWSLHRWFDHEVSELALVDLDGDGQDELVCIEPFHGTGLNIYKWMGDSWEAMYRTSLEFGHGLSAGMMEGRPMVYCGNRAGSGLSLDAFVCHDLGAGKVGRISVEEGCGPTQTQVFSDGTRDYLLSANQKKKEVALYSLEV